MTKKRKITIAVISIVVVLLVLGALRVGNGDRQGRQKQI